MQGLRKTAFTATFVSEDVNEGVFHGIVLRQGSFYIGQGKGAFTVDDCCTSLLGIWDDGGDVWGSAKDKHKAVHGVKGKVREDRGWFRDLIPVLVCRGKGSRRVWGRGTRRGDVCTFIHGGVTFCKQPCFEGVSTRGNRQGRWRVSGQWSGMRDRTPERVIEGDGYIDGSSPLVDVRQAIVTIAMDL